MPQGEALQGGEAHFGTNSRGGFPGSRLASRPCVLGAKFTGTCGSAGTEAVFGSGSSERSGGCGFARRVLSAPSGARPRSRVRIQPLRRISFAGAGPRGEVWWRVRALETGLVRDLGLPRRIRVLWTDPAGKSEPSGRAGPQVGDFGTGPAGGLEASGSFCRGMTSAGPMFAGGSGFAGDGALAGAGPHDGGRLGAALFSRRHRSEQKRTFSQSRAHFRRQRNGRLQVGQVFSGRSALRLALGIVASLSFLLPALRAPRTAASRSRSLGCGEGPTARVAVASRFPRTARCASGRPRKGAARFPRLPPPRRL